MTKSDRLTTTIETIVRRVMRQDGFEGKVDVSHVRKTRNGYSARVRATYLGVTMGYTATIVGQRVRVTKGSVISDQRRALLAA